MILAGDVGGTNTRLALFSPAGRPGTPAELAIYPSRRYRHLENIVRAFLAGKPRRISAACFGVAGPVKAGVCQASNLAWRVDSRRLAGELGLERVGLVNDLEANAYGIETLGPEDFASLNAGEAEPGGNAALISAGTGLGEAGLHWEGDHYRPIASEGGHCDFAPRDELEMELLRRLRARFARVSYERVVSGPGLCNIYQFLRESGRGAEPGWLAERLKGGDPSAEISRTALERKSELCAKALDLFVAVYGSEAGNLALKFKATGGLYVGGGIAPKILPRLKSGGFMSAFAAKGRLSALLKAIPVRVILNDQAALRGAALLAQRPEA